MDNSIHPKPPSYSDVLATAPDASQLPPYPHPSYNRDTELPGLSHLQGYNELMYPDSPPPFYHSPPPVVVIDIPPSYTNPHVEPSGFTTRTFDDKNVVREFVQKVFAIICLMLLVTVGIVSIFTFVPAVQDFFRGKFYFLFIFGGLVLFFYIWVAYSRSGKAMRRKYPANLTLIAILTVLMSLFTGVIASYFATEAVIFAFAISASICFLIAFLSLSKSFSLLGWCGGYVIITLLVLLVFGIFSAATYRQTWYLQVVWGFIVAFLFGIFLAYDINQLVHGEDSDITAEDYVVAAIQIYVDVVVIFIIILLACCAGGSAGG